MKAEFLKELKALLEKYDASLDVEERNDGSWYPITELEIYFDKTGDRIELAKYNDANSLEIEIKNELDK